MLRGVFLFISFFWVTSAGAFVRQCRLLNGIRDNNCEHSFALEVGSNEANESSSSSARRKMLVGTLKVSGLAAIFVPEPALSGEVGARITKAVTTSDLGVSVRRSVVKGAQVIDSLDGKWEQFSGTVGSEHPPNNIAWGYIITYCTLFISLTR